MKKMKLMMKIKMMMVTMTKRRRRRRCSLKIQLENVHWISIPVHIGDPIGVAYGGATWRVMFEKNIDLLSSVPPLARWRDCVPIQVSPLLIRTLSEVDS